MAVFFQIKYPSASNWVLFRSRALRRCLRELRSQRPHKAPQPAHGLDACWSNLFLIAFTSLMVGLRSLRVRLSEH